MLLFCCFAFSDWAFAQQDTLPPQKMILKDNSLPNVRNFDAEALKNYRNNKEFNYEKNENLKANNILEAFFRWLFRQFGSGFQHTMQAADWLRSLIILVCVGLIIYVVLQLAKSDWVNVLLGKSQATKIGFDEVSENIHEIDFEAAIAEAIAQKKYTRATRLFYLKNLKILTDKQHIDWQLNKTNHDYVFEVSGKPFENDFRKLTFLFDYVCYGDFQLSENDFKEVEQTFRSFEQKVA
jgi:hypothetical protein